MLYYCGVSPIDMYVFLLSSLREQNTQYTLSFKKLIWSYNLFDKEPYTVTVYVISGNNVYRHSICFLLKKTFGPFIFLIKNHIL